MSTSVFRSIGPYDIQRQIGRGGMAMVFLATDTRPGGRVVALKVIPVGADADARDIAEAEQRGAALQRQFLATSTYVPEMYEVGQTADHLYIAMEYLEGEDLATIIKRGPLDPLRAAGIAIQVCRFLEEIDHLEADVPGGSALTLLHNDLKPTNIRVTSGDRVKVLDFGAAKALSITRRVTRNDYYSTPYLSPECLDTGERDRQTDTWALGVILYEMVSGATPFRASDTRRLEDRIRSRRPPEPLWPCPPSLQAVIAKLLASDPQDRYSDPAAIREDLERFVVGAETAAEREGWPARALDEPPTRRMPRTSDDEPATRRIEGPDDDEPPTRRMAPSATLPSVDSPPTAVAGAPAAKPVASRRRRWLRAAVLLVVVGLGFNEAVVWTQSRRLGATVPLQDFDGFGRAWNQYERLRNRSYLGVGTRTLGQSVRRQALVLAEGVTANYRTPTPTVREAQWMAAATALERALTVSPGDDHVRGTLRYTQGQLARINGEAAKSRDQIPAAERHFANAIAAFREAANLRRNWPDPFLGLARTFIYGLEDIDRGADAMEQARKLGHVIGPRETAQLADGYRARGDALDRAAGSLGGLPQEIESLTRARDAYRKALELYTTIADLPDVPAHIRTTQNRLAIVERKLNELEGGGLLEPFRDLGRILRGL
jgi:serine/threonine protein kinase